jgi:hypothetical protein
MLKDFEDVTEQPIQDQENDDGAYAPAASATNLLCAIARNNGPDQIFHTVDVDCIKLQTNTNRPWVPGKYLYI